MLLPVRSRNGSLHCQCECTRHVAARVSSAWHRHHRR